MCNNHSSTVQHDPLTDEITVYHGLTMHHEPLIAALSLDDQGDPALAHWLRTECKPPYEAVTLDQMAIPAWAERLRETIDNRVREVAQQAGPIIEAWQSARDTLDADYEAKRDTLDADYSAQLHDVRGGEFVEVEA